MNNFNPLAPHIRDTSSLIYGFVCELPCISMGIKQPTFEIFPGLSSSFGSPIFFWQRIAIFSVWCCCYFAENFSFPALRTHPSICIYFNISIYSDMAAAFCCMVHEVPLPPPPSKNCTENIFLYVPSTSTF